MKNIKILALLILITNLAVSQSHTKDTIRIGDGQQPFFRPSVVRVVETGLFAGYGNISPSTEDGEEKKPRVHIFELGIWRSNFFWGGVVPFSRSIYFGNDFLLNDSKLFLGPKIGGFMGFYVFAFGAELIYFSNFENGSLVLAPYFGFGIHPFKLTGRFFLRLAGNYFEFLSHAGVGLTVQFASLRKRTTVVLHYF